MAVLSGIVFPVRYEIKTGTGHLKKWKDYAAKNVSAVD
jgi:hypothetical protein